MEALYPDQVAYGSAIASCAEGVLCQTCGKNMKWDETGVFLHLVTDGLNSCSNCVGCNGVWTVARFFRLNIIESFISQDHG